MQWQALRMRPRLRGPCFDADICRHDSFIHSFVNSRQDKQTSNHCELVWFIIESGRCQDSRGRYHFSKLQFSFSLFQSHFHSFSHFTMSNGSYHSCRLGRRILNVAEKPSVAKSISNILSEGRSTQVSLHYYARRFDSLFVRSALLTSLSSTSYHLLSFCLFVCLFVCLSLSLCLLSLHLFSVKVDLNIILSLSLIIPLMVEQSKWCLRPY